MCFHGNCKAYRQAQLQKRTTLNKGRSNKYRYRTECYSHISANFRNWFGIEIWKSVYQLVIGKQNKDVTGKKIGWLLMSGGFTTCHNLRPSSGWKPKFLTYPVQWWTRRNPTTRTWCPTLFQQVAWDLLYGQGHRHGWTYQGHTKSYKIMQKLTVHKLGTIIWSSWETCVLPEAASPMTSVTSAVYNPPSSSSSKLLQRTKRRILKFDLTINVTTELLPLRQKIIY